MHCLPGSTDIAFGKRGTELLLHLIFLQWGHLKTGLAFHIRQQCSTVCITSSPLAVPVPDKYGPARPAMCATMRSKCAWPCTCSSRAHLHCSQGSLVYCQANEMAMGHLDRPCSSRQQLYTYSTLLALSNKNTALCTYARLHLLWSAFVLWPLHPTTMHIDDW